MSSVKGLAWTFSIALFVILAAVACGAYLSPRFAAYAPTVLGSITGPLVAIITLLITRLVSTSVEAPPAEDDRDDTNAQ